jgi:membrane-associated phospholipid phosphatase
MSIDGKRRIAAAAFIALLALSVTWPEPVLEVNSVCCHERLSIDTLSFLGREAPSWDVAFWCIAGLLVIAILHSASWSSRDFAGPWRKLKSLRPTPVDTRILIGSIVLSAVAVALTWRFADAPAIAWAEAVNSERLEDVIRLFNRFGGGMNPAMVVLFFIIAGVVYRRLQWVDYGVAMVVAGLAAGLFAQVVKYLVGRARPELWFGPFTHARASATSFPSGHTVGAFALGSVLAMRSGSSVLRIMAVMLAIGVGLARILAFRHWPSDVIASALMGATFGWIATRMVGRVSE